MCLWLAESDFTEELTAHCKCTEIIYIILCFSQVHPEGKFVVDIDKSIDMADVCDDVVQLCRLYP